MKGLILKDLYIIKSWLVYDKSLYVLLLAVTVFFDSLPWKAMLYGSFVFGSVAFATIQSDKYSGWTRFTGVLPVSREQVVSSKYIMHILIYFAVMAAGFIPGLIIGACRHDFAMDTLGAMLCISTAIYFIAGALGIPGAFMFEERIVMIIVYAALVVFAALLWSAAESPWEWRPAVLRVMYAGLAVFGVSWLVSMKKL